MKTPHSKILLATLFLGSANAGFSQTTWDFGGTPDKNWSTLTNWSTDANPAATAVVFGAAGTTANATTVGNIVDGSYTGGNSLTSLTYGNTGASSWQVTQIASGQTLNVGGTFRAGTTQAGAGLVTVAAFTGSGTLSVNAPSSNFTVASSSGTGTASRATLDLSNLSTFSASVNAIDIGGGNTGFGTFYLADNSTLTATTLSTGGTGSSYGSGASNSTYFGTTTALNIDTLSFGGNRTFGTAQFRPASSGAANTAAVTGATLTIRGSAGGSSSATSLSVGSFNGAMPGAGTSSLNLTGGSVDALVTTLKIGASSSSLSQNVGGSLSMASGTFTATNVTVGETTTNNAGTGSMTGTLNVSGGTFSAGSLTLANNGSGAANNRATVGNLNVSGTGAVNVTGNLVMGVRSGVATVTSTVSVSGGTLLIDGSLAEGAGTASSINSTVNLSGGTLDMTHGNVAVDTLNFTGGTLKDVASLTGALTLQNSSTLAFGVDGNFTSLSLSGSLDLSLASNLGLTLANGYTPLSSFTLVSNDGADAITGVFGTINGAAFGPGATFDLTNDLGTFAYSLSYLGGDGNDLVALAVPEPSTYALLGAGLMGVFALRRIRSKV